MAKRALLPLFLLFAEAEFACVAANLFAGDLFCSVREGGICLCSREFIRREYSPGLVIRQGLITPFFSPQRQTISCATATYNRRGFVRMGTG